MDLNEKSTIILDIFTHERGGVEGKGKRFENLKVYYRTNDGRLYKCEPYSAMNEIPSDSLEKIIPNSRRLGFSVLVANETQIDYMKEGVRLGFLIANKISLEVLYIYGFLSDIEYKELQKHVVMETN